MVSRTLKEVLRFGIVGGINTAVDFGVFFLSIATGVPRVGAQVLGYTAGVINSFVWNKHFTFQDNEKTSIGKVLRFLIVNLFSLGVSSGAIYYLPLVGIAVGIAKVIVTILTLVINFVGYRLFVFGRKEAQSM